ARLPPLCLSRQRFRMSLAFATPPPSLERMRFRAAQPPSPAPRSGADTKHPTEFYSPLSFALLRLCPAHGLDHAPGTTTGRAWLAPVTAAGAAAIGAHILTCPRRAGWYFVTRTHSRRPAGRRVLTLRLLLVSFVIPVHTILL